MTTSAEVIAKGASVVTVPFDGLVLLVKKGDLLIDIIEKWGIIFRGEYRAGGLYRQIFLQIGWSCGVLGC